MERVPPPPQKRPGAQCRIGFQPVSPDHGTNHRESDLSHKYCRQFIDQRGRPCPGKGSSCGPGDRLEAYPTLLSGASSDDPRLSCVYSRHYLHQTIKLSSNVQTAAQALRAWLGSCCPSGTKYMLRAEVLINLAFMGSNPLEKKNGQIG
jgi:hypothetical protein